LGSRKEGSFVCQATSENGTMDSGRLLTGFFTQRKGGGARRQTSSKRERKALCTKAVNAGSERGITTHSNDPSSRLRRAGRPLPLMSTGGGCTERRTRSFQFPREGRAKKRQVAEGSGSLGAKHAELRRKIGPCKKRDWFQKKKGRVVGLSGAHGKGPS